MDKRTFRLVHREARMRAAQAVAEAPDGYVVTIAEPTRRSDINAALHARLTEIAAAKEWDGARRDIEVWKRLFVAAWCREVGDPVMLLRSIDGAGVDIVHRKTSEMTQREVTSLLSYIDAWCAENITEKEPA